MTDKEMVIKKVDLSEVFSDIKQLSGLRFSIPIGYPTVQFNSDIKYL